MSQPFISLIVPVKNASRTLDKTFEYLINLDYPKDQIEIIVADGDSTDNTVEIIQKWQALHPYISYLIVPKSLSPGHARNAAIEKAKGEYLLFTDGDCAPEPDWANKLLSPFFKDEKIGGVGGEIHTLRVAPDSLTESYCEQTGFLSVKSRSGLTEEGYLPTLTDMSPSQSSGHRAPFFATANAAYSMKAIQAAGGGFWHHPTGEDVEFSLQIQMAGYRLYFKPSAIVKHMHRITEETFMFQWFGYGQGHAFLVEKHATQTFEIVFQIFKGMPRLNIPFPKKGLIYIGNYHMIWISGFFSLLTLAIMLAFYHIFWLGMFLLWMAIGAHYLNKFFGPCLNMQPRKHLWTWCRIRWNSNTSFIKGGLDGTKHTGIIYIEPSW